METTPPSENPKPVCTNCGRKMTRSGSFCPHCGQRRFDGRIRLADVLSKFLHNLTHVDNKFLRMAWQLLIPGRVTVAYFQGKIKQYPHPVQFFFVVMFFFLLLFNRVFDHRNLTLQKTGGPGILINPDSSEAATRIELDLYTALERHAIVEEFRQAYDSLPDPWRTPLTRQALDSAAGRVDREPATLFREFWQERDTARLAADYRVDSIPLGSFRREMNIAAADLVRYPPEELMRRYHIDDWQDRILLAQALKTIKDPQGMLHTYLGSLTWTILALVAFMALVLRLLYWRKHYYVEHFIFLLHQHSATILGLTLAMTLGQWMELGAAWLLVFAWLAVAMLLAMRRFYRQSWLATGLKWLAYSVIYGVSFVGLFLAGLLLSFLIF